jgi:hypothetical protein
MEVYSSIIRKEKENISSCRKKIRSSEFEHFINFATEENKTI